MFEACGGDVRVQQGLRPGAGADVAVRVVSGVLEPLCAAVALALPPRARGRLRRWRWLALAAAVPSVAARHVTALQQQQVLAPKEGKHHNRSLGLAQRSIFILFAGLFIF